MESNLLQINSWTAEGPTPHVCNCIGCCQSCGGCRTNPKHTDSLCKKVTALNKEISDLYA